MELEEGGAGGAELRRGMLKKHFVPVGITNRDKRVSFVLVARPGTKGFLLLSRHGVPGWETGTKKVSQPGQIKVFVVVIFVKKRILKTGMCRYDESFILTSKMCHLYVITTLGFR